MRPQADTAIPSWVVRNTALTLGLATFVLYAPSLWFDLIQLDTRTILLEHPDLYNPRSLWRGLQGIFFYGFPREEPLIVRDIVWAIEARIFGLQNPFGYHLGNVLLNAGCTAIAFLTLWRNTRKLAFSTATAAMFAVLTVHVQPVCWAMGSKDLLVAGCMGLALIVQREAMDRRGTERGRVLSLYVLVLHMLAILSKFSAVFFFVVLALHRVFAPYLDGSRAPDAPLDKRRALRDALPVFLGGGTISAVLLYWYNLNLTQFGVLVGRGPASLSPEHLHKLSQFIPWVLALNVKLLFWPFQYSIMYQYPNANIPLTTRELWTGYATLLALVVAVAIALRKRKDLAFYALSAGVLLVPYLNIQYIGYWIADRYLYGVGLFVLAIAMQLGFDAVQRFPRSKLPLTAVFCGLLVFYSVRTLQYEQAWRDELTFFRHETTLDRPSVIAWEARAKEAARLGKLSEHPNERAAYFAEARASSKQGLGLFERLALPLSHYRASERLYASRMLIVLGDVAQAEGKPLATWLPYYERAYGLAVSAKSAIVLAEVYMNLINHTPSNAQEPLARKSFSYFGDYVRQVHKDSLRRQQASDMLERNYRMRFPFLATDIAALRERYLE